MQVNMKRYTFLSQLQHIQFNYFTDFSIFKVSIMNIDGVFHFSVMLVDFQENVHYYDFSPDSDDNYSFDDYLMMSKEIFELSKK